jgi:transcriptional regulator with XRE-family HTH domain
MTLTDEKETKKESAVKVLRRRLGARIVGLRQRKGWSQEVLAERLGATRERLAKWEAGAHAPPPEDLVALGEVLDITVDALLTGECAVERARARMNAHLAAMAKTLDDLI